MHGNQPRNITQTQLVFRLEHLGDSATDHALDRFLASIKGSLDGLNLEQVWPVCLDPTVDSRMELRHVFDHQGADPFAVEGEHRGAVAAQKARQHPGGFHREKAAIQEGSVETADHGPIGGDHHRILTETYLGYQRHGVSLTAAGGNNNFNAGSLGGPQSRTVAWTDPGPGRGHESAIDIDRN